MIFFLVCVSALVLGYVNYSVVVERIFRIDVNRPTPAITQADAVDYVKLPLWKTFLIQLLDIAGIGLIFGPIMAALYGPQALLWIVLGSIFAGGVHDFFSGMMLVRFSGENLPLWLPKSIKARHRLS
jgi:carbon starvation protein CstA